MVHSAYDSYDLLTDCPARIEAVELYASNILLGCSDGSLRIYGPDSSLSYPPPPPRRCDRCPPSGSRSKLQMIPHVLLRSVAGYKKRPFLWMEVSASRELLLTLSESVAFHGLPDLETAAVLTKARGANVCSWDEKRGFICFARKNRVCIFRHDGGRSFVEEQEFGVPDTVKSMSWCGENICLGIGRKYMIMNATNGALSEIFACGRLAPPQVVPLVSGELILGQDDTGVLVDRSGKLLPEGRICWSEAPQEVVIQEPYVIGMLPGCVEIRCLRAQYPLIQTVVLRNVRHLAQSSNGIVVAQDNSVRGLFSVPITEQVMRPLDYDNYEEALVLCRMLLPENIRASKEYMIHVRYAHYLLDNGSYEHAMDHFLAAEVEITYVLSLYPSIILPERPWYRGPEEFDEHSTLESKKMSRDSLMALTKFLQKQRDSIIEKAILEGTKEVVIVAVADGIPSDSISRLGRTHKVPVGTNWLKDVIFEMMDRVVLLVMISFVIAFVPQGLASSLAWDMERERATTLDTALLQDLLLTGQSSAAVELLKGLNYCDVKVCEEILQMGSHRTALLELYKSNSMHREALKVLHYLVEESKSTESKAGPTQRFKPEMIIEYLKPLCETDPMLILQFAVLVGESCQTQTLELFLSGNIPPHVVYFYLSQHAPDMVVKKKA